MKLKQLFQHASGALRIRRKIWPEDTYIYSEHIDEYKDVNPEDIEASDWEIFLDADLRRANKIVEAANRRRDFNLGLFSGSDFEVKRQDAATEAEINSIIGAKK